MLLNSFSLGAVPKKGCYVSILY